MNQESLTVIHGHVPKRSRQYIKAEKSRLRAFGRLCLFFYTFTFFATQSVIAGTFLRCPERRRRFFVRITQRFADICVLIQGIQPTYKIHPDVDFEKGYLVVCNHLGYTDIMTVASKLSGLFVTSNEIKETPFLGYITVRAGCLFVERRRSKRTREGRIKELADIANAVKDGSNVMIFPEATSTNGDTVLEFKPGLFEVASNHRCEILPMTINYTEINGNQDVKAMRDNVFWYGDMTFFDHFFNLLSMRNIKVEITMDQPFVPEPGTEKTTIARMAHERVKKNYIELG